MRWCSLCPLAARWKDGFGEGYKSQGFSMTVESSLVPWLMQCRDMALWKKRHSVILITLLHLAASPSVRRACKFSCL